MAKGTGRKAREENRTVRIENAPPFDSLPTTPVVGWAFIQVPATLSQIKIGRQNQVLSSDIRPHGRFPVIDQGQSFIAGYSDEGTRVIRDDLPLVIFGDHTRCLKFVDFPFILGADGTKVLKPRKDLFDAKFFYYALLSLEIPNRGYNRHFTILKEKKIPRPEKGEQRKIAGVLGVVQRAMEQQGRLLTLTEELKKTLLHQLFTQGLRGEHQKQTEIGPVPESWEVVPLGKVAKFQTGGTPSRDKPEYWQDGEIPWVKTGEIDYRVIDATEEKITRIGLDNSSAKIFPAGTLLVAMYGQGVTRGRAAILGINAAANQACAAITPQNEEALSTRFIYYHLQYHYGDLRQMGHGANQKNLNMALLRGFQIAYPSPDKQATVVDVLTRLDQKLAVMEARIRTLTALFSTLLHHLMTAQIRVHDLDVDILECGGTMPPSQGTRCDALRRTKRGRVRTIQERGYQRT